VPQLEILDIVVSDKEYSTPLKQSKWFLLFLNEFWLIKMTGSSEMAADLIASCPNIQQLTIREWNRPRRLCEDVLVKILKLEKLKILRVCLNGIQSVKKVISTCVDCVHYLTLFRLQIVNGCLQLECLHLWLTLCGTQSITDFTAGISALKLPENVRELAIDLDCFNGPKPNYPSRPSSNHQLNHRFLLSAAERWTALNVLILKSSCVDRHPHKLPETIVHLVSRLTSLSHLALIGDFPTKLVGTVKRVVKRKIQSVRPSFRLYIGPQLYHIYYPYE
jgi:hypothetical protein